jgi:hypothetical protein
MSNGESQIFINELAARLVKLLGSSFKGGLTLLS